MSLPPALSPGRLAVLGCLCLVATLPVLPAPGAAAARAPVPYAQTGAMYPGGAPDDVAFTPSGQIVTTLTDKAVFFDASGNRTGQFTTQSSGGYVTAAPDGTLYVSNFVDNKVEVYDAAGNPKDQLVGSSGYHFAPGGLAVHPSTGQLWIANPVRDEVLRVSPNAPAIVGTGTGSGQLDAPWAVAYGNDSMYVVDRSNDRIQKFDATSGAFRGLWGQEGFAPGQFRSPVDVAVAPDGRVLVLDRWTAGDSELETFDPFGNLVASQKIPVSNASGLTVDPVGNVYVAGLLTDPQVGWGVVKLSQTVSAGSGTGTVRAARVVKVARNRKKASVRLTCAAGAACTGTVTVRVAGRKAKKAKKSTILARGSYTVRPGTTRKVTLALSRAGRRAVHSAKRTKVAVTTTHGTRRGVLKR